MWWKVVIGICIAITFAIWACLKVASDCDDASGLG